MYIRLNIYVFMLWRAYDAKCICMNSLARKPNGEVVVNVDQRGKEGTTNTLATIWPVAFLLSHRTTCAVLFMARLWRQLATVTAPTLQQWRTGTD